MPGAHLLDLHQVVTGAHMALLVTLSRMGCGSSVATDAIRSEYQSVLLHS